MRLKTPQSSANLPVPTWNRERTRLLTALAFIGAATVSLAPSAVHAQRGSSIPTVTMIDSLRADGSVVSVPLRAPSKAFNLFAAEDFAVASFRSSGNMQGAAALTRGPVPFNQGVGSPPSPAHIYGNRTGYVHFEMGLAGGAPPHEWRKIRNVHPGARNMRGAPGYTATWQFVTSTPNRTTIDAADGQFGKTFSGVSIVFDGSCRDDINFFSAGWSLMAMKDCPATWGSEGFMGQPVVPDSIFQQRFAANPNAFTWDEYKIPRAMLDQSQVLGTQAFYGYMSDYNREIRLRYGGVVPGGAGAAQEDGYPLGLEMRVDGWQFATPAIRNTQFYQLTFVNKSAELYGTGIDYDSLYYGLTPGILFGAQNSHAWYFDIARNSVHVVRSGTSGQCSNVYPRRQPLQGLGCITTTPTWGAGIYTITWLKSPLGDTRNKLFSNPESPFYAPNHPQAGDTITYNKAMWGGFGQNAFSGAQNTRIAFGGLAKTEADFLNNRTPAELGSATNFLNYFNPEDLVTAYPDAANAKFPKFVPSTAINPETGSPFGRWDYNHDGVPDTISVPGCGRQGCHKLWSDTNPGGFAIRVGNIHNVVSAGPFALKAGDTTQFLWAFTWSPDTLALDNRVGALIDAYYSNWEGPQAIAFPAINPAVSYDISSAELRDSLTAGSANSAGGARIVMRLPQINPVDEYFLRQIERVRQDSINNVGNVRRILRLNPGLLQTLRNRANDNLAAVYIFKSCDGGTTWTTTGSGINATCVSGFTRNADQAPLAFSWRPVQFITYTNGIPSSGTYTEDVMAGRNYIYSFVTRTRGFRDIRVIDSVAGQGFIVTDVQQAFGLTADTISSALATNGSSVISFYAPISNAAGRTFARVDTSHLGGKATQDIQFTNVGATVSGTTRLVYANRLIVRKTIDTVTSAATTTITAQYVVPNGVLNPGDPVTSGFVARSQSFTANANIPVRAGANPITGTFRNISGSSRVFVDTINAVANSMGYVWVTADNRPIYATDNQYAANFDRDQQTSPLYPGYTVRSRDSSNAGTGFRTEFLISTATTRDRRFLVRAPGDTMLANARQFTLFTQPIVGNTVKNNRGGSYEVTWQTDPFGPDAPFTLDPVDQIQDKFSASLDKAAARMTNTTVTDARFNAMVGATAARPLVRVKLPFTATYTDAETGETSPVQFAMLARTVSPFNTRLLGSGNDTVRVSIPDSVWMPGDTLWMIHKVRRDSTIVVGGTRVAVLAPETINGVAGYRPIQVTVDSVGIAKYVMSCAPNATSSGVRPTTWDQSTCNPLVIRTRGATPNGGYLPIEAGWKEYFELTRTFDARSEVALTAMPFSSGNVVTKAQLEKISVVPNPYVVRSDMDELNGRTATPRIWFTGVPEQGILRIYSVSGQWLQELTWTASDLTYQGNVTVSGDLPYDLRTREGVELSSGLYLYVLTATGPNGRDQVQRGKFVIIR